MARIQDIAVTVSRRGKFDLITVTLHIANLPSSFRDFSFAQLSDFHYGSVTPLAHIEYALNLAQECNPKAIVFTGDFLQLEAIGYRHFLATKINPKMVSWLQYRRKVRDACERLAAVLAPVTAPHGIFAVLGNHDYLEGAHTVQRRLGKHMSWLRNESALIERDGSTLQFAGIDDLNRGKPDVQQALLYPTPNNSFLASPEKPFSPFLSILLAHNPDIVLPPHGDAVSQADLIVCGHTHGGQVCFPFCGPLMTRTKQRRHISGFGYHGETIVYVNRGVGYGTIRLRVRCRPEVTLFRFL